MRAAHNSVPAQSSELSAAYKSLRREHQELLDKHQSQMIKIRMREKQLNEKIAALLKQKEEMETKYKDQIAGLNIRISQLQINSQKNDSQQHLSYNQKVESGELAPKIEGLTAQHADRVSRETLLREELKCLKSALKSTQQQLQESAQKRSKSNQAAKDSQIKAARLEIDHLKQRVLSLSAELQKQGNKKTKIAEQFNLKLEQLQKSTTRESEVLQQTLSQINGKLKSEMESKSKLQHSLQVSQQQLYNLELEGQELKKAIKSQQEQPCLRCSQLAQQLQLNAEMLKSVRMMLKFKEIELEGLRK